ncbi:MAG: restriction endonuclease subunit S [Acidobacteria bacterium]|nr:restriction endonuclease subunit S [Acidobacteriota bacterium]
MSWDKFDFKNFITLQRGFDLTRDSMKGGEYPVVGSNSIIGYHTEFKQKPPGVITGRSGSLGDVQFIDVPYWPHNTALWVKDFKGNDPKFVHYKLKTLDLARFNGGGAVPTLNRNNLDNLIVRIPPPPEQNRIASILSAYDDLIENNLKRIVLLEEAARQLYKEWFVGLRFPGHEHTRIVDGVPDGWSEGAVGNLVKVQSGYAFKSRDWLSEGNPVIKIKNIDNNTLDINDCQCVSDEVTENAAKFQLKGGDFLIAMTGATIGKVGIMPRTQKRYYLNQRVGILRPTLEPNPISFLFTFFNTENAQSQVLNFAAGAAQPNISPGQIESIKFLLPTESLLTTFIESCQPLFDQRLVLLEQNEKLKQARDLLLPRLMNGDITV